eukprot:2443867-Amphidinium_carterae.2
MAAEEGPERRTIWNVCEECANQAQIENSTPIPEDYVTVNWVPSPQNPNGAEHRLQCSRRAEESRRRARGTEPADDMDERSSTTSRRRMDLEHQDLQAHTELAQPEVTTLEHALAQTMDEGVPAQMQDVEDEL